MTIPWVEQLQTSSFRGVEFHTDSISGEGGRRIVTHEFPERDDVEHEDLGRAENQLSFRAYIIGSDYFAQRDKLIAALDKAGPGKLIHAYRGEFSVVCPSYRYDETKQNGGMVTFDLEFKIDTKKKFTQIKKNSKSQVIAKRDIFFDRMIAGFERAYTVASVPTTTIQNSIKTMDGTFEAVSNLKKIANTQAEFVRELTNLRGKTIALISSASKIHQGLTYILLYGNDNSSVGYSGTGSDVSNGVQQLSEMTRLIDNAAVPIDNTDATLYATVGYGPKLIQQFQALTALGGAAGLLTTITFDSEEDAQSKQLAITQQIDLALTTYEIDDDTSRALRDLRVVVVDFLSEQSITLPKIVDYSVVNTSSSLVLSKNIYGSINYENDIAERNAIIHPGFITTGSVLRVKLYE